MMYTRREVVQSISVAGAIGIAGCQDTQDPQPTTTTENNQPENPEAGVTFNQQSSDDGNSYSVTVEVVMMEKADHLEIQGPEGTYDPVLTEVGQTKTITGLQDGDRLIVVGELDGYQTIIQTYKVINYR